MAVARSHLVTLPPCHLVKIDSHPLAGRVDTEALAAVAAATRRGEIFVGRERYSMVLTRRKALPALGRADCVFSFEMKRPRKIITRVIVFLVVGAIVNVAVAVGSAILVDAAILGRVTDQSLSGAFQSAHRSWLVSMQFRSTSTRIQSHALPRDLQSLQGTPAISVVTPPYWSEAHSTPAYEKQLTSIIEEARGWPMRALVWRTKIVPVEDPPVTTTAPWSAEIVHTGDLELGRDPQRLGGRIVIPYFPIWRGFLINTLLYATVLCMLWLLIISPGIIRRRSRVKRGLCSACAYPVGTSDQCTECGSPLPLKGEGRVRVDTT